MHTTSASPTLNRARDYYVAWLREARDLSHHTVRAYSSDVNVLVRTLDDRTTVADLSPATIRRFFDHQHRAGISPASLRRRAAGIRSFCAFLDRRHLVPNSPWPTDGLSFQRTRNLPRALPSHDLRRLLNHLIERADIDHAAPHDQPLSKPHEATTLIGTALMLATGLRVGELVSFRTNDLDPSSRTIQVLGKGRRERIVYLTDDWLTHLAQAYLLTREHLGVDHNLFLFNSSLAPLSAARMRARLARAGQESGLCQHVTPHMLRHSAATQLIESGVNIRFVQRLLGHASLTTTEIYTHVTNHALQEAVISAGVLARSFGGDN